MNGKMAKNTAILMKYPFLQVLRTMHTNWMKCTFRNIHHPLSIYGSPSTCPKAESSLQLQLQTSPASISTRTSHVLPLLHTLQYCYGNTFSSRSFFLASIGVSIPFSPPQSRPLWRTGHVLSKYGKLGVPLPSGTHMSNTHTCQ